MNSDADYSYSEAPASYSSSTPSIQLPFALLSCSVAMFMIIQTHAVWVQKGALRDALKNMTVLFGKREPVVKQVGEIKNKLNAMIMDLIILSKTDDDAKTIIQKFNIQQTIPGSASDTPATPAG